MVDRVIQSRPAEGKAQFRWIDVVNPTPAELGEIAHEFGLHSTSVQDCMDPEHLPKYERVSGMTFIIVRAFDEGCSLDADTLQEMTRKVAIFAGENFLITIHRRDQSFIARIRDQWAQRQDVDPAVMRAEILTDLVEEAFKSFEKPIDKAVGELEKLEYRTFRAESGRPAGTSAGQGKVEDGYLLKRKASVYKRIFRLSLDLLPKMATVSEISPPRVQNLREELESLYFNADEILDSVNSLLNLHLLLASHRTNEVVRLLTVFSIFFLPLNFIASIYGMNFKHMPELQWDFGYPTAIGAMISTALAIFLWVKKRGWMR